MLYITRIVSCCKFYFDERDITVLNGKIFISFNINNSDVVSFGDVFGSFCHTKFVFVRHKIVLSCKL